MGVGDCGPGLIYGGQRLPLRRQVAQVKGDSLGSCDPHRPAGRPVRIVHSKNMCHADL